ncbi:MAG: hypothetical protein IH624_07435 [Phycisphaerae bacterium]|nr:hypothetical protein [Phycisphaerae bacterium]
MNRSVIGLSVLLTFCNTACRNDPADFRQQGLLAEYNRITKPADYDPQQNSADLFWQADEAYASAPAIVEGAACYWNLSDAQRSEVKTWLEQNEKCISLLIAAAQKGFYWKEYRSTNNRLGVFDFPEHAKLRDFAQLLKLSAEIKAYHGHVSHAFDDVLNVYRLAKQFQSPRSLIDQLTATGVSRGSFVSAFHIIANAGPDATTLTTFQEQLHVLLESRPLAVTYSDGAKLFARELIQLVFSDDGSGNGEFLPERLVMLFDGRTYPKFTLKEAQTIALAQPDKSETLASLEEFQYAMNSIREEAPWALYARQTSHENEAGRLTKNNCLLSIECIGGPYGAFYLYKCHADALITTLAILRYRANKGEYPPTLEKLIGASYLRALPMDPYSGWPLVYQTTDDDFTLYSVGPNFKNDGGKHVGWSDEPGDYVFWPVQER